MKTSRIAVMAALLCAGTALPAFAAMDQIGQVTVGHFANRAAQNFDLGGPIDSLGLQPVGADVDCRAINATFGNGKTSQIFSGKLYQGRTTTVDLPGDQRTVTRLAVNCQSLGFRDATIRVSADIGSHRAEWQANPNFARLWARFFNWGSAAVNGGAPATNWQYLGDTQFVGNNDSDNAFGRWQGRTVSTVALKPLNASARCSRVIASFGNGSTQTLDVNRGDYLNQGQFYPLDLRGDRRNLVNLALRCRATNARAVTIQIFTGR